MRASLAQDSSPIFFRAFFFPLLVSPIYLNFFWLKPDVAWPGATPIRHLKVHLSGSVSLIWRNLGWENVKYVERTGARQERKTQSGPRETERSSALLVPKLLQYPDPTIQAKEPWTGGPIFWRRWECSQHFRENTGVQTDRSWSQLVCRWPQVNYQESGRERWRLAHNWLHQHANPLYFSRFSPDLQSGIEFGCVLDHFPDPSHLYMSKFYKLWSSQMSRNNGVY